jgi:hypothetical protein
MDNIPEPELVLEPDKITTEPPDPTPLESPARMLTRPPIPESLEPTAILIAPDAPPEADPDCTDTHPELPDAAAPE